MRLAVPVILSYFPAMPAHWPRLLIPLLAVLAISCDACGATPDESTQAEPQKAPKATTPTVLTGTVKLADGYELPAYTRDQMEHSVLAHARGEAMPEICTPPRHEDRRPVRMTTEGLLSGVMITASEFSPRGKTPPSVRRVAIDDCRLSPALVVAKRGDILRLENKLDYPFMPTYGKGDFAQTMNKGDTKDFRLDQQGVRPLRCGVTAPCGRTDVVVLFHDFFTITDKDGHFRMEGFSPDETVKLHAWHPLFKESALSVKVEKGATKAIELVITPLPPKVAPRDAGSAAADRSASPDKAAPAL